MVQLETPLHRLIRLVLASRAMLGDKQPTSPYQLVHLCALSNQKQQVRHYAIT
jgi:hypothetical protein